MKYYIISGGGSGIGRAIAQKLSPDHTVILCGRNLENLEDTLSSLENPSHHKILTMDVRSLQSVQEAAQKFSFPSLDGIIANAGIGGANFFGQDDRWNDIIETNLSGTYYFVNCFLPFLRKSSGEFKHITIISSILARLGVSKYSAYCASKAGLLGLMRSWAMELAPEKILVNAICPGWVNTDMAQNGLEEIAQGLDITKDQFYQIAMQSVPLGKMSEPKEIAELTSYLLRQTSMTGQTLDINNGAIMNS
ncbi:SDR family oxidoreductase [bacterium]|nr:MAG: SDR family oxidoreductase [bacterium]